MGDEGGLGNKGCGEEGRVGEGKAVHADDEGLGLSFMHKDVVEARRPGSWCWLFERRWQWRI